MNQQSDQCIRIENPEIDQLLMELSGKRDGLSKSVVGKTGWPYAKI